MDCYSHESFGKQCEGVYISLLDIYWWVSVICTGDVRNGLERIGRGRLTRRDAN